MPAAVYGTPRPDVVETPRGARQLSPLIPGSDDIAAAPDAAWDEVVVQVPPGAVEARYVLAQALRTLKPGGLLILSTLNRTARSFGAAIIGAEWVMRWLPRGTHDWQRFITPDELAGLVKGAGLRVADRRGMVFNPLTFGWRLSERDLSVNYLLTARR